MAAEERLDVPVAGSSTYPNVYFTKYFSQPLSPKTVYLYPDSSADSSPFVTPPPLSPPSISFEQDTFLTSSEFVFSSKSMDKISVPRDECTLGCSNCGKNSGEGTSGSQADTGDCDSNNICEVNICSSQNKGDGNDDDDKGGDNYGYESTSNNAVISGVSSKEMMETGLEIGRATAGVALIEVNSLGTEWAGTKVSPTILGSRSHSLSLDNVGPVSDSPAASTSYQLGEEAARLSDQIKQNWSNFDKYGIDIDLLVGSSQLSPGRSSWYSPSFSDPGHIEILPYNDDVDLSRGLRNTNSHLCEPDDSEIRMDTSESSSSRGWSIGSPFGSVSNAGSWTIRDSGRSQASQQAGESSKYREIASDSSLSSDESHQRQPLDQLRFTGGSLGGSGQNRSVARKTYGFRLPNFFQSRSVPSSPFHPDSGRSEIHLSKIFSLRPTAENSHNLQQSRSKSRMVGSLKRWLKKDDDGQSASTIRP